MHIPEVSVWYFGSHVGALGLSQVINDKMMSLIMEEEEDGQE